MEIANKNCGMVQDLLPLYLDGVCSSESREFIENHLKDCDSCSRLARSLQGTSVEESLVRERIGVLERHAKKERTAAWKAGAILAGILMIPILIVAIVAAVGITDTGTVLVLAASMALVAAFTVVPLMAKNNRVAKLILTAVGAIVLIEFFVCEFFDGGSFLQIAVPTIFGLSIPLLPFVIKDARLPQSLQGQKDLLVSGWDTIWMYLTILAVTLPNHDTSGMKEGITVATFFVILIWIILGLIKLPKQYFSKVMKAGMIIIVCGIWTWMSEMIHMRGILGLENGFFQWTMNYNLNRAINANICIAGLIAGAILIAIGMILKKKQNDRM